MGSKFTSLCLTNDEHLSLLVHQAKALFLVEWKIKIIILDYQIKEVRLSHPLHFTTMIYLWLLWSNG